MKKSFLIAALLCSFFFSAVAQISKNAPTPPMGWNSWNYFGKKAINEKVIREVIDAMAASGLQKAGYEYIVVDGGWRDTVLGPNGELLANKAKFPSGMKALADYAHAKGFKFGLHTVPGSHDCGCDPVGGWGHEQVQFKQFMDWGLDFIKLDRCRFSLDAHPDYPAKDKRWYGGWDKEGNNIHKAFETWSKLIEKSGRKIVLSASAYRFYDWYPTLTNMGRTTGDIKSLQTGGAVFDSPKNHSVMAISLMNNNSHQYAKPGYWNDPDMLVTGKQGLTQSEQEAHFALWCIMSSPLILGNDPRNMTGEEKKILLNRQAIAINQDPTEQGHRIKEIGTTEIWAKKLKDGSYGVVLLNRDAASKEITLTAADLGLNGKMEISDVYSGTKPGRFNNTFTRQVPSHGCLFLVVK